MKVNGHVLHGVWERRREVLGCSAFQVVEVCGRVCVSFRRRRVGRLEGGGFPEHSQGFRLSRLFCWGTSQVKIGIGPVVAVVGKCHRSKASDTLPAHESEVVWSSRSFLYSSPVRTR